jgi:signal transduction histidine kinase
MTSTTTKTWQEVQDGLERLAMKLDLHLQQATSAERQDLEDALGRAGDALRGALDGMRSAAHDPAIREDLQSVGSALGTAVTTTLGNVGDELRKVFDRDGNATTKQEGQSNA